MAACYLELIYFTFLFHIKSLMSLVSSWAEQLYATVKINPVRAYSNDRLTEHYTPAVVLFLYIFKFKEKKC